MRTGVADEATDSFTRISVEDRLRIAERMAAYSWALDAGDVRAYLDCFTEDGVLRHPLQDGSPGEFRGRAAIESFLGPGFARRPTQAYGHQHQFNAVRFRAEGGNVQVDAYCMIFRHEFHRQYWHRGPSWRMGTWHARFTWSDADWRIAHLDVLMWTDTAFNNGTALRDRGPGMPGTRD